MQINENFTKVHNSIFVIIKVLSGAEFKIFIWIYRQTIGYGKKSDGISYSQFAKNTGVGKTQVQTAIKKLKELKLIKITKQKNKNGSLYFNRYSINENGVDKLCRKLAGGMSETDKGVCQKLAGGMSETDNTKDNNTKDNITKEERESIYAEQENIFFSLPENIQRQQIDGFVNYLVEIGEIKKQVAGKITITKKLYKKDPEQLQAFEEWYLAKECEMLNEAFASKRVYLPDGDIWTVENIYPYFNTTGYSTKGKIYISFIKDDEKNIYNFNSPYEAREILKQHILQAK